MTGGEDVQSQIGRARSIAVADAWRFQSDIPRARAIARSPSSARVGWKVLVAESAVRISALVIGRRCSAQLRSIRTTTASATSPDHTTNRFLLIRHRPLWASGQLVQR